MSAESSSASGGIGFTGLLAVLFIGLKLGHVIDWTWPWVLAPLWIPLVLAVGILLVIGVFLGVGALVKAVRS